MTCVSDRSGIASSGVRSTAHRPQAASITRGQQHQEAVGDRPADQRGDHRCAPDAAPAARRPASICGHGRRPACRELEVDRSARRQARGRCSAGGSLNSIVIAPIQTPGSGRGCSVTLSPSMRLDQRCAAVLVRCPLPPARAACVQPRLARPCRLASESIRNWPDSTTCWPASRPRRISVWPLGLQAGLAPPPAGTRLRLRPPSPRCAGRCGSPPRSAPAGRARRGVSGEPHLHEHARHQPAAGVGQLQRAP